MVKTIISFLLSAILRKIKGQVLESIESAESTGLSGPEKAKQVFESVKGMKPDWKNWAINLVIELGVSLLRFKQGESIES